MDDRDAITAHPAHVQTLLAFANSPKRVNILIAGRRSGKSWALAQVPLDETGAVLYLTHQYGRTVPDAWMVPQNEREGVHLIWKRQGEGKVRVLITKNRIPFAHATTTHLYDESRQPFDTMSYLLDRIRPCDRIFMVGTPEPTTMADWKRLYRKAREKDWGVWQLDTPGPQNSPPLRDKKPQPGYFDISFWRNSIHFAGAWGVSRWKYDRLVERLGQDETDRLLDEFEGEL